MSMADRPTTDLNDYSQLLELLSKEGFEFVVFGPLAVSAYAKTAPTLGERALDLLTGEHELKAILARLLRLGVPGTPRGKGRQAVIDVDWKGRPVTLQSSAAGLAAPSVTQQLARVFALKTSDATVPVADPFHVLAHELAAGRTESAAPLVAFLEEEVVQGMKMETVPRERITTAKRLLHVQKSPTLAEGLFTRLAALAKLPSDFLFLVGVSPSRALAEQLLTRAPDLETGLELTAMIEERFNPPTPPKKGRSRKKKT